MDEEEEAITFKCPVLSVKVKQYSPATNMKTFTKNYIHLLIVKEGNKEVIRSNLAKLHVILCRQLNIIIHRK